MQDGAGTGVTVIDGSRLADGAWTFGYGDLSKFNGKTVNIGFEAEIMVENPKKTSNNLEWQFNTERYPSISKET